MDVFGNFIRRQKLQQRGRSCLKALDLSPLRADLSLDPPSGPAKKAIDKKILRKLRAVLKKMDATENATSSDGSADTDEDLAALDDAGLAVERVLQQEPSITISNQRSKQDRRRGGEPVKFEKPELPRPLPSIRRSARIAQQGLGVRNTPVPDASEKSGKRLRGVHTSQATDMPLGRQSSVRDVHDHPVSFSVPMEERDQVQDVELERAKLHESLNLRYEKLLRKSGGSGDAVTGEVPVKPQPPEQSTTVDTLQDPHLPGSFDTQKEDASLYSTTVEPPVASRTSPLIDLGLPFLRTADLYPWTTASSTNATSMPPRGDVSANTPQPTPGPVQADRFRPSDVTTSPGFAQEYLRVLEADIARQHQKVNTSRETYLVKCEQMDVLLQRKRYLKVPDCGAVEDFGSFTVRDS